jgi:hypothetical protein
MRSYVAPFVIILIAVAAIWRPWESRELPQGYQLSVKGRNIFACSTVDTLKRLYRILKTDESAFVREGERLTLVGDCVYIGRGVQITGYQSGNRKLVTIRRDAQDREWIAPIDVFQRSKLPAKG